MNTKELVNMYQNHLVEIVNQRDVYNLSMSREELESLDNEISLVTTFISRLEFLDKTNLEMNDHLEKALDHIHTPESIDLIYKVKNHLKGK